MKTRQINTNIVWYFLSMAIDASRDMNAVNTPFVKRYFKVLRDTYLASYKWEKTHE